MITFKNKKYKNITFNIKQAVNFNNILTNLDNLVLPKTKYKPQNIKYAVLEMINNSLRAHRDNNITGHVSVTFECKTSNLVIRVKDLGPGFDLNALPYSLSEDPENIDTNSKAFKEYRERNNNLRFGLGLYVVKKISNSFKITFIDDDGNPLSWEPGKVRGTIITINIGNNIGESNNGT